MAKAISILTNTEKDELLNIKGNLIEAVQKGALSQSLKNKTYSGDINAGSVEFDRFINAVSNNYGTARTNAKGTALNNKGKVRVDLDTHKEIVEEVSKFDLDTKGVEGLVASRQKNHKLRMVSDLDSAFFAKAEEEGTTVSLTQTELEDKVEELIQTLETTNNEYVEGVDRSMMVLSLDPFAYGKMRNFLDKIKNPNIDSAEEEIKVFHGVRVESNIRQTKQAILMVEEAIAQPVKVDDYDIEKIPMSNNYALSLFYDFGTKATTPDLIKCVTTLV